MQAPGLTTKGTNKTKITKDFLFVFVFFEPIVFFVVAFLFLVIGHTATLYAAERTPLMRAAHPAPGRVGL